MRWTLIAVLFLTLAGTSAAENQLTPPEAEAPRPAGQRVWIDAEGDVTPVPTEAQRAEFEALWQRWNEQRQRIRVEPRVFELRTGGIGAHFPGGLLTSATVTVDADGQLHYGCSDHGAPRDAPAPSDSTIGLRPAAGVDPADDAPVM